MSIKRPAIGFAVDPPIQGQSKDPFHTTVITIGLKALCPVERLTQSSMTALNDIESALSSPSASDAIQAELEKEHPDVNEVAGLGLSTVLPRHLDTLCSREVGGVCKSSELAQQNKAKGAVAFKQCRYLEAACAYSESLRNVSTGTTQADKLAATLLANRALCLLKAQPQGQCSSY